MASLVALRGSVHTALLLFSCALCPSALAGQPPRPSSSPPSAPELGGLLVAPTRLVFEGRRRSAELTLVNTGPETATYRISFVQMRLTEAGALEEVQEPDPGQQFADRLVRYSPRQVVLEPGVPQTIRLQLRKPADLGNGEYRSHLTFRAVPAVAPSGPQGAGASGLRISLVAVYGVSVPIIVRQGQTAAKVTLTGLEIPSAADTGPSLRLRINRTGNRSVYGNLTATFVPSGGRPAVVGIMNGLAVYTPNPSRRVQLPLHPPPGVTLRRGLLRLSYVAAEAPDASREILASAEIALP